MKSLFRVVNLVSLSRSFSGLYGKSISYRYDKNLEYEVQKFINDVMFSDAKYGMNNRSCILAVEKSGEPVDYTFKYEWRDSMDRQSVLNVRVDKTDPSNNMLIISEVENASDIIETLGNSLNHVVE